MKKIIFLLMLLMSITIFAEKLTTDGKNNLDKLQGSWSNSLYQVINRGGNWYLGVYDMNYSSNEEYIWHKITPNKNSVFVIKNFYSKDHIVKDKNLYFAYDTKHNKMVILDEKLNILEILPRRINKPVN